jgi:membrane-associated protein
MENAFQVFAEKYAAYGYPVLFCGVLLENAGLPVPGETAVLVAGFLASPAGGSQFHVAAVILVTVVAAILGDNAGFWLGHRLARPKLQSGRRFLFLTPAALELAEGYFARYGLWTIFFARFITGLRVVGALAAGTAGMPWKRFLVANASGAVAWAVTMTLLGYFFGHSWSLLHRWLGRGGVVLLACVVVLIALPYLLRRLRRLPVGQWDRLIRAQVWQGVLAAVLEVVCIAVLVLLAQGRLANPIDQRVDEWLAAQDLPVVDTLAVWGGGVGILPVLVALTAAVLVLLWRRGRPWQEGMAMLWALTASEAVGLLLVGLLRRWDVELVRAELWPFGFAGLIPLRAFAVLGMSAHVLARQSGNWAGISWAMAVVLILLAGFGVAWSRAQTLTEVLLEYAAGALVLFAGVWWLEGFGPGLVGARPGSAREPGRPAMSPQPPDSASEG